MPNAHSSPLTVSIMIVDSSSSMDGERTSLARKIWKAGRFHTALFGHDLSAFYLLNSSKREIISIKNLSGQDKSRVEEFMDKEFRASGTTHLWEPTYHLVRDIKKTVQQQNPNAYVQVYLNILTDGEDNESSGRFHGTDGGQHLVDELEDDSNIHVTLSLLALGDEWSDESKGRLFLTSASTGGSFLCMSDDVTDDVVTKETRNFVQTVQEPVIEAKKEPTPARQIERLKQLTKERKFNIQMTTNSCPSVYSKALGEWNKMKNPSHDKHLIYQFFVDKKKW